MTDQEIEFLKHSNYIEGITDGDSLDWAVVAWQYIKAKEILTTPNILNTHSLLMTNQALKLEEKGYFRKEQVWVGNREGLDYRQIETAMADWVRKANSIVVMSGGYEDIAKKDHIAYEKIHPFIDGNGRTGRMFLNWQRLKVGLPILVIREEERQEYYQWFK